ncbi:MAG: PA14 domain-containing protein [Dehalococcoidales bacterium]
MCAATGITQAVFDANEADITVFESITRGGLLGRYYNGILGTSPGVLIDKTKFAKKVVELGPVYQTINDAKLPGSDGYETITENRGWAETHDCEFAGASAVANSGLSGVGIDDFAVIWDGYIEIDAADVGSPITFWMRMDDGAKLFFDDGASNILQGTSWQDQGQTSYSGSYVFQSPGWHKIRIEYYDNGYENTVMLKWKGLSWDSASVVPAYKLGYAPISRTGLTYNHAGIYSITSTGSMIKGTSAVALSKVTALVKVFGVWTQTTKEEFYGAFFGIYDDCSDGETFNVTWLDSCPTDEDCSVGGGSSCHWEQSYSTIPDSLKLGFWDNFDEDPAYSAVMMQGYMYTRSNYGYGDIYISFQDIYNGDGSDGDNEVVIECNGYEVKHFEVNRNYFSPFVTGYNGVFARAYVEDPAPSETIAFKGNGILYEGELPPKEGQCPAAGGKIVYYDDLDNDGNVGTGEQLFPVYKYGTKTPVYIRNPSWVFSGSYSYWQPAAPFRGCWLYAKGQADNPIGYKNCFDDLGFKTLNTDAHGEVPIYTEPRPLWPDGDNDEIRLAGNSWNYISMPYKASKALGIVGTDSGTTGSASYRGYVNGKNGAMLTGAETYPSPAVFKFVTNNLYLGQDWDTFERGQHIASMGWPYAGCYLPLESFWDNIRCIPSYGYLVSTPFYAKQADDSQITWGTVSWTGQTPGSTDIEIYVRKASYSSGLSSLDSGWGSRVSNGSSIGGTDKWIQYKAVLRSSAIDRDYYSQSSRTPVLEDVTITYLPRIELLYRK